MSNLQPKYSLFGSLAEMMAPSVLSRLLAKRVTHVAWRPIDGHAGVAGGKLYYVDTNVGRLVLKRMSMASDWVMFASQDHRCRSVTLWQYGLLDRLHPYLEHRIIACSHDGDGWAILMDDLTGHLFTQNKPMTPELVPAFLDALARLHATFWNDPQLHDPQLGLCEPAHLLDMTSLPVADACDNGTKGVIPVWVRDGWKTMEEMLDADVYALLRRLIENPRCVFGALSRYPYTLLHDFRAENVAYTDRPVAFDWQEASCSLMTIDLAWLIKALCPQHDRR